MEEKTFSKRLSSFRSVFNYFKRNKSFSWRSNLSYFSKTSWPLDKGLTLVELLVVISMVSIMASFLLIFLNPFKQIEKARDAQREQNLKQLNTALDTYFNDTNCYPSTFSFGGTWQQGAVSYMQKVPQDPDCASGGSCYSYIVDSTSTCPQWNILFAKIFNKTNTSSTCPLEKIPNCLPSNYAQSGYNFCVVSGNVDCSYMGTLSLPANAGSQGGGGVGGTPGPTSTPFPTSTSTPTPTPICSKNYACTGNPVHCNVISPAGSGTYCNSNCNGVCQ